MDEETATGGATTGPVTARPGWAAAAAALVVGLAAGSARGAEVEVSVSNAGFRPAELTLRKGETLRVRLVSTDREHCFAIDALRVEKRVVPGKRTTVEVVPDRAGTFPFHCCLEPENPAVRGRLVVTE